MQSPKIISGYRSYNGGYFKTLINPQDTGGAMAMIDITLPRGVEPPPHIHKNEDEIFYLLEGNIRFQIGEKVIEAKAGDAVFAPRMTAHHFVIENDQARFLNIMTPGKLMDYFMEFSIPAQNDLVVTPPQGPPPAEAIAHMVSRLEEAYGISLL
ncbi:MAG: cupin domain-containing protein [Pseudobacter sp.]|uniref:cupin domain-containing protein n=1 Tax=Pseudobacter sp. TaxID=2045420 RepID=UPI003F7CE19F